MQNDEPSVPSGNRPPLDRKIKHEDFCSFYWLKKELVDFCRELNISSMGSKEELGTRIEKFLVTGELEQEKTKDYSRTRTGPNRQKKESLPQELLSIHTIITENYRSDQAHRAFFQSVIGPHFHFTVNFMNFMKENIGKTYQDAIDEWYRERERKKDPAYHSPIAPQFEYNQYIRAYFEHNPDGTLQEAIHSWNMKKKERGRTTYLPNGEQATIIDHTK